MPLTLNPLLEKRAYIEKSDSILKTKRISLLGGKINIELEDVLKRIYKKDEDLVILGGTLIEGCGNNYSDLDVLVLTEEIPSFESFKLENHTSENSIHNATKISEDGTRWSTHDYYFKQGLQIEIQYCHISHFHNALQQVNGTFQAIKKGSDQQSKPQTLVAPSSLNHNYKEMFHRILTGVPIQNIEKFFQLAEQIPISKLCMAYYKWTRLSYSDFKDILGAINSSQLDNATYLVFNAIVDQMRALSHLILNTNDKPKWTYYYVSKFPIFLDSIKKDFESITYLNRSNDKEKMIFIERSFNLLDSIFFISNELIDINFPEVDRKAVFERLKSGFFSKHTGHPQVLKQTAFLERYCSKKFIAAKEFIDSHSIINPIFQFE